MSFFSCCRKNILLVLVLLRIAAINHLYGQQGYFKEIKDSLLNVTYGKVAYISVDSTKIDIVYNSRYMLNVPFIGGEYGQVYYAKLNKQTGQIIDKAKIASTRILNCESALMYNNFLYLGGSVKIPNQPHSAFLMKFNTQSKTIVWERDFYAATTSPNPNSIPCEIRCLQLNSVKDHIVFNGIGPFQWLSGTQASLSGRIDTINGNTGCFSTFGLYTPLPIQNTLSIVTEPKFSFSNSTNKMFTITRDTATNNLCIETWTNQVPCSSISYGHSARIFSIPTSGIHFICNLGNKIISLVDHISGSTCFVMDSASNILSIKKFIGIRAKSLSTFNKQAALTFVNDIGQNKGNEHIIIKVDSTLQIIQTRRTFIDTFQISEFTCKTHLDSNFHYSIFSKRIIGSNSVYVYKQSLSLVSCNELTLSPVYITPVSTNTQIVITYTGVAGSTNYTMNAQNTGLKDTTLCLTELSQVPYANFSSSLICQGTSMSFTDFSSNNPTSWLWEFSGATNSISTNQNPSVTFTMTGIQNVTLTATNNFGSNTTIKTVTVLPLPVISISNGSVCPGNSYTLNPSGAFTYTFLPIGPVVTPSSISTYSIIGTDINGCVSQNPAICTIGFYPLPTVSISATKTLVCKGEPLVLSGMGAITYTWSNATSASTTAVTPTVQSVYSFTGANSFGCVQTASILISVSSCLYQPELFNRVNSPDIFPNPVDQELTLSLKDLSNYDTLEIRLFNVLGQAHSIELSIKEKGTFNINMAKLSNGPYILVVKTGGSIYQKCIVVCHSQ